MTKTVRSVCQGALRLCGQIGAAGRPIGTEQETEVLEFLNQMLDSRSAMRSSIYTISIDRYTLTPSQTVYDIGPTATDFQADRPIKIEWANIVLNNTFPESHLPLRLLTDAEWAAMVVTEIPSTLPVEMYNDGASPNSNLYLWGYPTIANDLELFTWKQLPSSLVIGDTLELPPAYNKAITYGLACDIAPLYWRRASSQLNMVRDISKKAWAVVALMNREAPALINDAANLARGQGSGAPWDYYSYLDGGLRQ